MDYIKIWANMVKICPKYGQTMVQLWSNYGQLWSKQGQDMA